jgi:CheY-like chemotaxis protein
VSRLHQAVRREAETFQPVDLNEVIREAVHVTRPRWRDQPEARGITIDLALHLEGAAHIRGTRAGLQDILINLLFNAVDAMPDGGTIQITTSAVPQGANMVVADTGLGMDEETRRRVFEPFFTTKAGVGTGLGLSTVFGTVGRWGGRVEVESEPGQGTRFTFHFPGWEGPLPAAEVSPEQRPDGSVLVVDNDDTVCSLLERLLEDTCNVSLARTAEEATDRMEAQAYHAALIDLGVPGTPGDRICAALKAADPTIATVLMTGWNLSDLADRTGAFDFRLQKPFGDLAEVREVALRAVELCRMRRETNLG